MSISREIFLYWTVFQVTVGWIGTDAFTTPLSIKAFQSSTSPTTTLFMNKKKSSKKKTKKSSSSSTQGFGGGGGGGSSTAAAAAAIANDDEIAVFSRSDPFYNFKFAGSVVPGIQSPQKIVDPNKTKIIVPDYAADGIPKKGKGGNLLPWIIEVKTPEEIVKMKAAGKLAREVLDMAGRAVQVGISTDEIDQLVHDYTIKAGAYPSPLNYHGFPKSCCTSVNEVICHGIPDSRKLKEGDVINVDITVYLDGYHGDCSEMFVAGEVDPEAKELLQTTYDCWLQALNYVKPGNDYKDLGALMEDYIVPRGFSTVRNFCGHGIGSVFHTTPNILHYKNSEPNGQMAPGHTFTIEPMICEGSARVLSWPDDWTATTIDGKRSAQFEHTLLITQDGVEALTAKNENSMLQFWEKNSEIHKGFWLGTSADAKEREEQVNSKLAL